MRVVATHATAVAVELAGGDGDGASRRHALRPVGDGSWHARLTDAPPGTRYGFRVDGPFDPAAGHLHNPAKLLLDPYARLIDGPIGWDERLRTVRRGPGGRLLPDPRDSAPVLPRGVVLEAPPLADEPRPRVPWRETVIYECHVKGMTRRHPGVPPALRGTYLGLASEPVVAHLRALGVTAVELLPVHHKADDAHLHRAGLTNYWGYATAGYLAPDVRFATRPGRQVAEFREMVRRLHAAGIEVLLDVVYNHTGEGDMLVGPTFMFRGLDNAVYYRGTAGDPPRHWDVTGCGNTLDPARAPVARLVLDSLRYWVQVMGVDGFRFDLATTLGRAPLAFDAASSLLAAIAADPVLAEVKLIAEPWDLGPDGYQLGRFPAAFAEWNGRWRDAVRRFWRGGGGVGELAARLAGSADLFAASGRPPQASVNFVTCHDGFTLADLVAYEAKHNLANGEGNRDGSDWNESRNWGVEGPTADRRILALRDRVRRSLAATLALSAGVPMLSHGDELLRTQRGNNNAYCQDGPLAWVDWTPTPERAAWLAFVRELLALRRMAPALARTLFFPPADGPGAPLTWHSVDGAPLAPADWDDPARHVVVACLRADATDDADGEPWRAGERVWVAALNGGARVEALVPPAVPGGGPWRLLLDTAADAAHGAAAPDEKGAWRLAPHALVLLEAVLA